MLSYPHFSASAFLFPPDPYQMRIKASICLFDQLAVKAFLASS